MNTIKTKFNIMDLLIIISLICIITASVIQGVFIRKFEDDNVIADTLITLKVSEIDEMKFIGINIDDSIYAVETFGKEPFGKVVKNVKMTSTLEDNGENQNTDIVEYELIVSSKCRKGSEGFYSVNNKLIGPGMTFEADNGKFAFLCEIVSVKIAE